MRGEDFAPREVWVDEFVLPRRRSLMLARGASVETTAGQLGTSVNTVRTLCDGSFRRPVCKDRRSSAEALQLSVLAFMASMAYQ